jgi:hypothetical protein
MQSTLSSTYLFSVPIFKISSYNTYIGQQTSASQVKFYTENDATTDATTGFRIPGSWKSVSSKYYSHYYTRASAECDSFEVGSAESIAACNILANLCVFNYYDASTTPCATWASIVSKRKNAIQNDVSTW